MNLSMSCQWLLLIFLLSYLIKQCRSDLNKQVNISTTPGLAPGARYSFKELLTDKARDMVNTRYKTGFN